MSTIVPAPAQDASIPSSWTKAPASRDYRLKTLPSDWSFPECDINRCIRFSRLRCVFSIVSLLLLITDIPRTGLGVKDVFQLFPNKVGPNTAVYFGPWAYPVAHIWTSESRETENRTESSSSTPMSFQGTKGSAVIKTTSLWSYEYDSTSIGMRGVAELLNASVTSVDGPDRSITARLELKTTWTNLDALVSMVRAYLSPASLDSVAATARRPNQQREMHLDIATVNVWVDRLHHYLYRFAKTTMRWRLHSIHSYTKTSTDVAEALDVCLPTRRWRPTFCNSPYVWWCVHPVNASLPKVPIWDHVNLRVSVLQRKYPDLSLDVTIFTTFNPSTSIMSLVSAFFESEVFEIVVLTRGRRCSTRTSTSCSTVFADDYRYERGTLASNIAEWYSITATLRAIAQVYVWIRLALLFRVAYCIESPAASPAARVASALRTMSKIPFQVVVYGSLFPVVLYVVAHLIDCSFVDLYLEMYWTTVNGVASFDVLTFARHASVQMRNVWIIALGTKAAVFVRTRLWPSWQPRDGIVGVRGLAISLCSALSVLGPYRSLSFRDSSIVSVLALGVADRGGRARETVKAQPVGLFNVSVEGLPKDMKMTLLAVSTVVVVALVLKAILRLIRPLALSSILFGQSILVPYSAGIFWSPTSLSVRFAISLDTRRLGTRSVRHKPMRSVASTAPTLTGSASPTTWDVYNATSGGHWRWRAWRRVLSRALGSICYSVLGIDRYEQSRRGADCEPLRVCALRLDERTVEINSVVQLINLAMMTDPWTLFRLRVLGREVYFYESTDGTSRPDQPAPELQPPPPTLPSSCQQVFLLPCSPDKLLEWTGFGRETYRLKGHMSSCDLPWSVLLQCG